MAKYKHTFIVVVLFFSVIGYFFIERPLRNPNVISLGSFLPACVIAVVGLTGVLAYVVSENGLPSRYEEVLAQDVLERDAQSVKYLSRNGVLSGEKDGRKSVIPIEEAKRVVLLIGDSFSSGWSYLYQALDKSRFQFMKLEYRGCNWEIRDQVDLQMGHEARNNRFCDKILLLNDDNLVNNIDTVILASNDPLNRFPQKKFNLIEHILVNNDSSRVLILCNYAQPEIDCLDLMIHSKENAGVCLKSWLKKNGEDWREREIEGEFAHFLQKPRVSFVSLLAIMEPSDGESWPFDYAGVPFVFDRVHLRPLFIGEILRRARDSEGDATGVGILGGFIDHEW